MPAPQVIALNVLTERYYAFVDTSEGRAVLLKLGISERAFDKQKMPAAPSLMGDEDTYADMW